MLYEFLVSHRDAIIANTQARVAVREFPKPSDVELTDGIPVFLDQLGDALRLAESSDVIDHEQILRSAGRHGHELLRMGLTIGQVVHDYGDVCQAITELAVLHRAPISGGEFQTLNLCLDDAIAGAVTEFARQRELTITDEGTERLGVLAHELRNLVHTAILAFESIRTGHVAAGGSTGQILSRSLTDLTSLIDCSLADVRLDAGIERMQLISVADFLAEVEIGAALQAQARGVRLTVTTIDPVVTIEGDRQILAAAIANLLQNAFKFTGKHSHVSLTTSFTSDRVLFDIEDECGGLPPGMAEGMFLPFRQGGSDRSGVGLGLSICLRAARLNCGELRVRNLPGKGCVFTLDLPRKAPKPLTTASGKKRATASWSSAVAVGDGSGPATKAQAG